MSFLYPHILWFLFLPALLAGLVALARRKTGNGWLKLVSAEHTDELVTRRPAWRSIIPAALCILALACTIAALARPINGFREAGGLSTGRNLLIALDISRSMETQDVKPSRLEEARAAAYELIDSLPSDKIGLIVFSGDADLVVPLTYDHTALRDALEQVNRNWAGTGGTNFGLVLKRAMQDLKRSAPDGTNALVLLSDGEDTVGSSLDIAEEARKDKLLVITVGVGTAAGGPIPDPKGQNGLWQDADGKHVISKLDADSLRKFSEATGGDFAVLDSNTDLAAFTKNAVRKIDKHEENVSTNKVPNDLFAWFAWTALALLVVAIVVATEWRLPRRGAAAVVVLLLLLLCPAAQAAPSAQSVVQYTIGLMQEGQDDANAREAFSEALLDSDPQMQAAAFYQIGNVGANATIDKLRKLYGGGEEAQQAEQTSTDPDEDDASSAAAPQAPKQPSIEDLEKIVEELKKDILPYENALKIAPDLKPAESNIAKIKQLIKDLEEEIERLKQQQQQQQQQNQDQQNQQDKQNQDQQQQDQKNQQNKDNQQKQDQKDQQDKDQQQEQDQQNQQDKQNQDQQQQQQQNQDKQQQGRQDKEQDKQQQNQDQQDQRDQKQQKAKPENEGEQPVPMTEEEKAQQSAADILRMHLDEEKGSPIPHAPANTVRPPRKDY